MGWTGIESEIKVYNIFGLVVFKEFCVFEKRQQNVPGVKIWGLLIYNVLIDLIFETCQSTHGNHLISVIIWNGQQ